MSKAKSQRPEVCYYFAAGGVVVECGVAYGKRARTIGPPDYRALRSDREWQEWQERNPGAVTWKTIDGARVAD